MGSNLGEKILQGLAESLNVSKRTLYYAVEFARKYPRLDTVPEGKNITWNKIITKYLLARKENNVVINPPEGLYNIIVIDPPWPIEKIQRDCRPNQIDDTIAKLDNFDQALVKADTFEGVKKLHDYAAAAEAFARAANLGLEPQNYAAEKRLRAARKAGWYLEKLKRGQGKRKDLTSSNDGQSSDYAQVLEKTGTTRQDASRWQTIAAAAESLFDKLIEEGKGITELTTSGLLGAIKSGKWHPMLSSGEDEWWTPKKYMDAVREVMGGIDLDPASCADANKTVQATKYYDRNENGLDKVWEGRAFLNPPYGAAGPEFIEKFIHDYESTFNEGIILVNSRSTDADWFQPMFNGVICFTDHRIDFDSPGEKKTSSTHGSCFIYFGPNEKKFSETFAQFGNIVKRWSNE